MLKVFRCQGCHLVCSLWGWGVSRLVMAVETVGRSMLTSMRCFQRPDAGPPFGDFGRQAGKFCRIGALHDLWHRQFLPRGQVHIRDRQLEFCRPHLLQHRPLHSLQHRPCNCSMHIHKSLGQCFCSKSVAYTLQGFLIHSPLLWTAAARKW